LLLQTLRAAVAKAQVSLLRFAPDENISKIGPLNCRSLHYATLRSG
jgi:hypothetical protein